MRNPLLGAVPIEVGKSGLSAHHSVPALPVPTCLFPLVRLQNHRLAQAKKDSD